jgi:TldD protein
MIGEHRVDDADLYFQTTRHEGWSLEEGIVKSGSFSIDQGVGVRAVAGEKTAFAYSDDLSAKPRCWTPRAPCAPSPQPARSGA